MGVTAIAATVRVNVQRPGSDQPTNQNALFVTRGACRRRRSVAGRRRFWSADDREHGGLPGIPITDMDRRPVAHNLLHRTVVLSLHRSTPLAEPPSLIACFAQERRNFLIGFGQMVANRTFWNMPSSHFSMARLP
jgi:hypothetical protein